MRIRITFLMGVALLSACNPDMHNNSSQMISASNASFPLDITKTYYYISERTGEFILKTEDGKTEEGQLKIVKHCYAMTAGDPPEGVYFSFERMQGNIYLVSVNQEGCFDKGVQKEHIAIFAKITKSEIFEVARTDPPHYKEPNAFLQWAHNLSDDEKKSYGIKTSIRTKLDSETNTYHKEIDLKTQNTIPYKAYLNANSQFLTTGPYAILSHRVPLSATHATKHEVMPIAKKPNNSSRSSTPVMDGILLGVLGLMAANIGNDTSSSSSGYSSGYSCKTLVTFVFDGPGADSSPKIQMSGPSGTYLSGNDGNTVSFGGSCVAGNYSYNYTNNAAWFGSSGGASDVRSYSGSFAINGQSQFCDVKIGNGYSNVYC